MQAMLTNIFMHNTNPTQVPQIIITASSPALPASLDAANIPNTDGYKAHKCRTPTRNSSQSAEPRPGLKSLGHGFSSGGVSSNLRNIS